MDPSSSDAARLLRAFAVRVLTLALVVGIAGDTLLTPLLALAGLGLLLASAGTAAEGRQDSFQEVFQQPPHWNP
ncbi:hypothetical protein ACFZCY_14420 [Streptomyces sp. NPDC007983]|uniref:hypothetical protein n=1 Tax=Streptomyces sp. NPDC007983 TaxID=3364800 RepID=UPI0036E6F554